MSNKLTLTADGIYVSGNKVYLTVQGVHRKVLKAYRTVGGVHRLGYTCGVQWLKYKAWCEDYPKEVHCEDFHSYKVTSETDPNTTVYDSYYLSESGRFYLLYPTDVAPGALDGYYTRADETGVYQAELVYQGYDDQTHTQRYGYNIYRVAECEWRTRYAHDETPLGSVYASEYEYPDGLEEGYESEGSLDEGFLYALSPHDGNLYYYERVDG